MIEFLAYLAAFIIVGLVTGAQILRAQGIGGGSSQNSGVSCLVLIIGTPVTIFLFVMMIIVGVSNGIIAP